uniref:Hypothetical LAGLIDADG homing endonuclease n=1 Tax=Pseudomuriella schumacherensis TaxID=889459 RepID=A0A076VFQ1_PSESB|nr:hypothetical LAGLIDADG homing endonuclease [Pseudomuriella schumacherensis]AIK29192.1 hypothetical LAGLIDADG homing endonuclease [Pseudomuriella schumacherensis]
MNSKHVISKDFLEWFVGFVEGDQTPRSLLHSHVNTLPGKKGPCGNLQLVVVQKEGRILQHIRHSLNMGTVRLTREGYWRYVVSKRTHIEALITMLNGKLVLEKRHTQFAIWVRDYNELTQSSIAVLPRSPLCLTNAWLSGFIDAEGCFNISLVKSPRYQTGVRVRLRFLLDQKDSLDTLTCLTLLWKGGFVGYRAKSESHCFVLDAFVHLNCVVSYLKRYKLLTEKRIVYHRWKKVLLMVQEKKHLTLDGLELIRKLKALNRRKEKDQTTCGLTMCHFLEDTNSHKGRVSRTKTATSVR